MIENLLKNNNIKITKQRVLILDTIIKLDTNANIKNILKMVSDIDKSTVYRTLEHFVESNILDKTLINNEVIYEIKEHHKHYLKCIKCNKIEKLEECPFEDTEINGFKVINHVVNIEGICSDCQKK